MKKDIEEILNNIMPDTTIEEVAAYCDTVEDLELILKNIPDSASPNAPLPDKLKQRAQELATVIKKLGGEVTTARLQRFLKVPYPQAAALCEWLKSLDGD